MKKQKWNLGLLALMFIITSCGRDDTQQQLEFSTRPSFKVDASLPTYNAVQVDKNQPIQLTLSQNVDINTVVGNVTLLEQTGSSSQNITNDAQVSVSGNILTVTLNRPYLADAGYRLTLSQGLKSVTGESLRATSIFPFYTGLNPSILGGANNDPTSPPKVISAVIQQACGWRGFLIRFNEDVVGTPQVDFKIKQYDAITIMQGTAITYAADNMSTWVVDFGENPNYETMFMSFEITVQGSTVVDYEGNTMSGNFHKDHNNSFISGC